jgi:hypothetical protein
MALTMPTTVAAANATLFMISMTGFDFSARFSE